MKLLNGAEIAGYMKANQEHQVKALISNKIHSKLVIIRDNENPVINKYVELKQQYGADIGVEVEDWLEKDLTATIEKANNDPEIHGLIVQLPVAGGWDLDELLSSIKPEKDVDGLATELYHGENKIFFDSATATAINWLISGYDIPLERLKVAIIGRGRLIGQPLARMWRESGYDISVFHRGSNLAELKNYDVLVSATGVPHIIKSDMVRPGAVVIDAGTASEDGVIVGDVDDSVRERDDLAAITPKIGGVGPLTVTALFEHVLTAAKNLL